MPADRKDLQARLAAATPADTVRGLIFNGAFSIVREHLGDGSAKDCDPAKTGSRTDFFSYPVSEYLEMAWNVVDRLEKPLGSVDAGFFRIGHRAVANVLSSMLGRTLITIAGQEPQRLIANAPSGYRATVSYGERTVEFLADRHARLVFKHDFLVPPFHCGVLTAAVEMLGGKNVRATGQATGLLEAVYDLAWE